MSLHNNLLQKANETNVRVFLTGEGGDEIVSYGQNYIRDLTHSFQWRKLFKEINGYSNNREINKFKISFEKIIFPFLPLYLKKTIRSYIRRYDNSFSNKDFFRRNGINYMNRVNNEINKMENFTSKELHYYVINSFSHHSAVFEPFDRICGVNYIEPRYPFFDKRLVEFCYAIPTEIKLRFGWDRYILRLAMNNILPEEIQWRVRKTDFSQIYKRNLLLFEKDNIEELIDNNNEIIGEYIDLEKFKIFFKKFKNNNKNVNTADIWLVILLLSWLESSKIK